MSAERWHESLENLRRVQGRVELVVHGGSLFLALHRNLTLNDRSHGMSEESIQLTAQLRDVLGARFVQSALSSCNAQGDMWQSCYNSGSSSRST